MHTFNESGAGVPAFLAKLWRLVDDPKTDGLICWRKDGRSFIIQNQAQFARELLPQNYKHNNMASFIRQLNMYGFHKVTSIDNGGLKFDRDEMEFSHPCFKRNCPYLLEHIKRKIATSKNIEDKSGVKSEAVTKVLQDVKAMRGRQDSLDSRFSVMKQENEALWREIASLRQKHAKQQQIVNKLIHFLITIVQPSRKMTGVKRVQLMINDNPQNARNESEVESDCGPIIHELTEELLDEVANDPPNLTSMIAANNSESPERPQSSMSMISNNYDYSNLSTEDVLLQPPGVSYPVQDTGVNREAIITTPTSPDIVQTSGSNEPHIVYHVTEEPDGEFRLNMFNEENHLATPMVRKQMKRSQLIKQQQQQEQQRNNKRHNQTALFGGSNAKQMRTAQPQESLLLMQHQRPNQNKQQQQAQQQQQSLFLPTTNAVVGSTVTEPVTIKCETQDPNDSIMFLNMIADAVDENLNEEPLASPNLSAFNNNSSPQVSLAPTPSPGVMLSPSPNIYSPNTFVNDDINTEIFENADLLATSRDQLNNNAFNNSPNNNNNNNNANNGSGSSNSNNNNFNIEQKQQQQQQPQQQQPFDTNLLGNGKFASFLLNNTNNNISSNNSRRNGNVSTSTVTMADGNKQTSNELQMPTQNDGLQMSINAQQQKNEVNNSTTGDKQGQDMTVAKFKSNGNEEIMRLSNADEVNGHLENVQDELDTLKDLLRADTYSLDANTLMGLFNEADILNPFGLGNWSNDMPNENKKGSELAYYHYDDQPLYDLSDIMNIEKDEANQVSPSTSRSISNRRSPTLDTPRHD